MSDFLDCPNCQDNCGYTVDTISHSIWDADENGNPIYAGEWLDYVQVQCEFCWTNPLSVFNNSDKAKAGES